ncbi:MAG: nucleotide exchange factor GrpE [Thermoflexaceae bacterium]|nr:nucleotide exchange factor GrpE [Thermoflexaceae bacterium]
MTENKEELNEDMEETVDTAMADDTEDSAKEEPVSEDMTTDSDTESCKTKETQQEDMQEDADESQDDSETDDKDGDDKSEKGNRFFKKDKKEKKDKKDIQIEELTDKYKRTMAEFDNFRKRTEKEKAAMYEIGAKDIIEKILPIVDNFERGLSTLSDEEKTAPFADGMDKVYKQLLKTLEDVGVKPIDAVGKEFDPNLHNAVMHIEDENLGENVVAEEFQKGYTYRESVVRHSMVKVAN